MRSQFCRYGDQPPVTRPQAALAQTNGGEEVRVDIADAATGEFQRFDHRKNLAVPGNDGSRQSRQMIQDFRSVAQIAQGQFADDERVTENPPRREQGLKVRIGLAKMIDPYRRIDKNHPAALRRGGSSS